MKKIIFTDFDNTIYSHTLNKVPDSTVEAFNLLKKNEDVITCLLTGRSLAELGYFDLRGIKFDYYGLVNGQIIFDKDFNILYDAPIEGQLLVNLLNEFNKKEMSVCLSEINDFYANIITQPFKESLERINSPLPPVKEYKGKPIYLSTICYDPKEKQEDVLKKIGDCAPTNWDTTSLDIVTKGVNKGNCVKKLINLLNISIDDTISFGDGYNDIEMLKTCKLGIAMGNSEEAVKMAADEVTDAVDKDGFYNALKKHHII